MPRILIAGKDWTARALLRAQLLEEGIDVEACEDVPSAVQELWASDIMPRLLVADVSRSDDPAKDVSMLSQWAELLPIWILTGHTGPGAEPLEGRGFERIIFRPIDMGKLVKEIKERLAD